MKFTVEEELKDFITFLQKESVVFTVDKLTLHFSEASDKEFAECLYSQYVDISDLLKKKESGVEIDELELINKMAFFLTGLNDCPLSEECIEKAFKAAFELV